MFIFRHIGKIIIFVLIAIGLVYGFWPKPILVEMVEATKAYLVVTVEQEGKTRVMDRFLVSAPISGYARRVPHEVGDPISQNAILVEIEPLRSSILDSRSRAEAEARLEATRSALFAAEEKIDASKADLDFSRSELARKDTLRKARTISAEALELAKTTVRRYEANYRSAGFGVEVAKFKLAEAQKTLEYSNGDDAVPQETLAIKAPVAGSILRIYHKSEGVVQLGEPLIEMGDPNALEVEIDVLSEDAVKIHSGTKVFFKRWGGGAPLEGIVKTVEPVGFTKISALGVEEQRVLVIADILSTPTLWQKLGDGYRVEASFIIWEQEDVLQVPASSLFRQRNDWALYAVEVGRAMLKTVKVGKSNGLQTQILSGIQLGDEVIVYPDDALSSGMLVEQAAYVD